MSAKKSVPPVPAMDFVGESKDLPDLDIPIDTEISKDEEYAPGEMNRLDDGDVQDAGAGLSNANGEGITGRDSDCISNDEDQDGSDIQTVSDKVLNETDLELGQLGSLTHAAIGDESRILPSLPLVASMPRNAWLQQLKTTGYAGLLYVDMKSLQSQDGYQMSWWFNNRHHLTRRLVQTPLESAPSAGIFTLNRALPGGRILNSVISTVAELVGSDKETEYAASTLQLFVPSEGGFSQDFRLDSLPDTADLTVYRCFWYLCPESGMISNEVPEQSGRDCIFIGSAGNNVKEFSGQKVVSLGGYYGEADRKFRLHPGDILVMDAKNPFAVDLPIGGRAKGARVLSWHVFPKTDTTSFLTVVPVPEIVMNIEDMVASNEEARDFYQSELDTLETNPGPIGDPECFMQRLRVTPSKYHLKDVNEEVEKNPSILYIDTDYFSS